jgi:cytidylate kinase
MCLVTLSATYGAGGSLVGPALAKRLDVPFLDRVISTEVAARLAASCGKAPHVTSDHAMTHLVASLAPIGQAFGMGGATAEGGARAARLINEEVILERADSGRGVILGRAGAAVLRDHPAALHVRLDGPRERRLQQAMWIQEIDRSTARRRMRETDHARHAYVRHFRRADARDPTLYHLIIDSTVVGLNACVEIAALAAEGRAASAAATAESSGGHSPPD